MNSNLNTLRILYIIKGILTLLVSFFPLIYIFIGLAIGDKINQNSTNPPPFDVSLVFVIIGSVAFLVLVAIGVMNLLASKYIKEVKNYNFVFVTAVLTCLGGMLGIALGVFTLIELSKPEVKTLFTSKENTDLI